MQIRFGKSVLLALSLARFSTALQGRRKMVSFHGRVTLSARRVIGGGMHHTNEKPPDPRTLLSGDKLEEKSQMVR
jgi:hypothetical protein